jgi:chromosome segregation ATPase
MKRLLFIILAINLSINFSTSGQDTLSVTQSPMLMSKGTNPGFTVIIPQANLKDVVNAWKKYIKQGTTKPTITEVDGEYQVKGTTLVNISPEPINVYTQIKDMEKSLRLTAYFTEDDSTFISSELNPEKANAAEKYVKNFAQMIYRVAVENELEVETKKLSVLEEEKEDMIHANEKSEKTISENERKSDHAKTEIEANSAAQGRRKSEVEGQKEVVRVTTPKTETYDLEKKKLSTLEKELKKLENDNEGMHKDIENWNDDNSQLKRNIEKNENLIGEKKEAIEKQKSLVKEIQAKLERMH